MSKLQTLIKEKQSRYKQHGFTEVFKKEDGAIDLASIMVGVIVIGLIGGVIAATVFAVIPWAQDNAAKQQLDSIVQAENAYFGLSSANPSPLPAETPANSFGKSADLQAASLLANGPRYCVTTPDDKKSYTGYSQSGSGTVFTVTDKNSKPEIFAVPTGSTAKDSLPADCQFISVGMTTPAATPTPTPTPTPPAPYVDPTPTITKFTFKCDINSSVLPPIANSIKGTGTWSDGTPVSYNSVGRITSRTLTAGVTYTFTFEGTFARMLRDVSSDCLRSVDHWGSASGTTDASMAFENSTKLTAVPDNIPTTITNMNKMFSGATSFNDPNIGNWNVSNVTNMGYMFNGANNFNQPLNNWNVNKVTDMSFMFFNSGNFNQSLNNWDVSNVNNMVAMFDGANAFNQDLGSWNTSKVQSMAYMTGQPDSMKYNIKNNTYNISTTFTFKCDINSSVVPPIANSIKGIGTWSDRTTAPYNNTGRITSRTLTAGVTYTFTIEGTFARMLRDVSSDCLRSVDHWGSASGTTDASMAFENSTKLTAVPDNIPTTITNMSKMFIGATSFNDNIDSWDVSNVTNMNSMFDGAKTFNQPLNNWKVENVTDMSSMFKSATSFNQPLNNWQVGNVTDMILMFNGADSFNQDLGSWNTSKVQSMAYMTGQPDSMKYNIKNNTYNISTTFTFKCDTAKSVSPPIANSIRGTGTWSDGTFTKPNSVTRVSSKPLSAGITYTFTIEGTFMRMLRDDVNTADCLRSVDHWGSASGTTDATQAFENAVNLTTVPANIPATIANMSKMFIGATSFNDSNVKSWDVSKVTNMSYMFSGATSFNQDLKSSWNTAAVTNGTFFAPASFPDAYMPANTSK